MTPNATSELQNVIPSVVAIKNSTITTYYIPTDRRERTVRPHASGPSCMPNSHQKIDKGKVPEQGGERGET